MWRSSLKSVNGQDSVIGQAQLLAGQGANAEGWMSMAIRVHGPQLWLLVNDQPVLYVEDTTFEAGGVMLQLYRSGSLDDDAETSVLLRNLRVTNLVPDP